MSRRVVFILVVIVCTLVFLIVSIGSFSVFPPAAPIFPQPHVFGVPVESVVDIHVMAVYFVPRDGIPVSTELWRELLDTELRRLQQFHHVQFRGFSRITYTIYQNFVNGRESYEAYDINTSRHNDPAVLRSVTEEVIDMLGLELGAGPPYEVLLVLYEGAGAAGSSHYALISRLYFEQPDTRDVASTFLAHEFYHALGVPDMYQTAQKVFPDGSYADVELLQSLDIMGRVRIPLEESYLSPETLNAMGI